MPCRGMKSSVLRGATTGCVLMVSNDPPLRPRSQERSVARRGYGERPVDDIDRQIVALLRQDARRSFQSIGMRVALSAPAVKRRVDRLEADGVIRGYSAQGDPRGLGWGTHPLLGAHFGGGLAGAPG